MLSPWENVARGSEIDVCHLLIRCPPAPSAPLPSVKQQKEKNNNKEAKHSELLASEYIKENSHCCR